MFHSHRNLIFILLGLLTNSLSTTGQEFSSSVSSLKLLDGKSTPAKLVSIESSGDVNVLIGQEEKKISADEFLRYGAPRSSVQLDTVILNNGTRLACVVTSVGPTQVTIVSRLFKLTNIPTQSVRGILFHQKSNPLERQKILDAVSSASRDQFQAVLRNEDIVRGQLLPAESEKEIKISYQGLARTVPFAELSDVRFPSPTDSATGQTQSSEIKPQPSATASMRMGLIDGSRLVFQDMQIDDSNITIIINPKLKLIAPIQIRRKTFFDRVCYFQPRPESYRFVSEETPLKLVDKSEELMLKTRFDRSVVGGPLISQGREYEFGIGTHSGSQVIYPVREKDKYFRATIAFDDTANQLGDAVCRVLLLGDDNRWKVATESIQISRQDSPKIVSVDVEGAKAIGLVTSSGKFGKTGDRLNWVDARMHQ